MAHQFILTFDEVGLADVPRVGGKNASLGELRRSLGAAGVRVPPGFAVTADGHRAFLRFNRLEDPVSALFLGLEKGRLSLAEAGRRLRALVLAARWPEALAAEIRGAYAGLGNAVDVAGRSSATAEDLPEASFAGQHESFLNVRGAAAVLDAGRRCYASLFTDRAIAYRREKGFDHDKVALSLGVQRMVRADRAGAGVLFSLHTETGFPRFAVVNAVWGLGENIVQGVVTPDEHLVYKPALEDAALTPIVSRRLGKKTKKMVYAPGGRTVNVPTSVRERERYVLTDEEVLILARWAVAVEKHYGKPMDMEWAKDGRTGELFMVQARPETVQSRRGAGVLRTHRLTEKGRVLLRGTAVGEGIVAGPVQIIRRPQDRDRFRAGSILVTGATDPDWVPVMKRAAGIVTDLGGRTSHAAIVSRELGLPAVVGTGRSTATLKEGQRITLSCAEGETGVVYAGDVAHETTETRLDQLPTPRTRLLVNIASPSAALQWWRLPVHGVGLARMEFIINDVIRVHPLALVHPERVASDRERRAIARLTRGRKFPVDYFVDLLAEGIGQIAAVHHPNPVIVRLSDFKTNEYAHLLGGAAFEPKEENPMLGFRGASRYYSEAYREGFALECRALKKAREVLGLTNIVVMVPFCRTPEEADRVLAEMAKNGLARGREGLQVYVMCEIPSNVVLAEEFADRFDGFSIGSNDLTQLTLGVDRDSGVLAAPFDERNEAVKRLIADVIRRVHAKGRPVGICGQAPSDHPDFAAFLVRCGIDSISLNPDSVAAVLRRVAAEEKGERP